jgi:sialate O-acetylesterase
VRLIFAFMLALGALLIAEASAFAHTVLSPVFSDGMILQRDAPIRIWGESSPCEELLITLGNQSRRIRASKMGEWAVEFDPLPAGGSCELTVTGRDTVRVEKATVGDVFLCSGQSNMVKSVGECLHESKDLSRSADPDLRFFVPQIDLNDPSRNLCGQWRSAAPDSVSAFSAVAYHFAKELREKEHVPIGIIQCPYPGSQIRAWISKHRLQALPPDPTSIKNVPDSSLFDSVMTPLSGIGVKAFLWYQGETDMGRSQIYPTLFATLVHEWRQVWKRGDVPFFFVQLPNCGQKSCRAADSTWAEFREAQQKATLLKNCFMAVTYDTGIELSVPLHPSEKRPIAHRLALLARNHLYGEKVCADSPMPSSIQYRAGSAIVKYDGAVRFRPCDENYVRGFELAAANGAFFPASASIRKTEIVVSCSRVKTPEFVRFAWADNPSTNLYTIEGIPAGAFRTDSIPTRTKSACGF